MAYNRVEKDMFKGTIDELLQKASTLDVDQLYKDLEKKECIDYIMREAECDETEANAIYEEICLEDVKNTLDTLIKEGLVEVTSYNEKGEPLYTLTEKGHKKVHKKNSSKKKQNDKD